MHQSKAALREHRHNFSKWWFDFIERFLMVGALGVANEIVSSFWLGLLYIWSLLVLGLWMNDSFEGLLANFIQEEPAPRTLQRFSKAFLNVARTGLVGAITIGTYLLIMEIAADFIASASLGKDDIGLTAAG